MAYSMYAVKLSNDIPVQSDCISIMGLFLLLSSVFNLIVMLWFIVLNYFKSKDYLPKLLSILGDFLQKIVCSCFHKKSIQILVVSSQISNSSEPKQKINLEDRGNCRFCLNKKNAENDKIELKKIPDLNFEILNKFFFILFLLFTIISNVSIWCSS